MNSHPSISIIIPTLNEQLNIGQLLESIQRQSLQPSEVIVVDARSTDNTRQIAQSFPSVTVLQRTANIAAQRNMGANTASGNILIFLDADTLLPENFLQAVVEVFDASALDIACPWYAPRNSSVVINTIYFCINCMFYLFQWLQPSGAGSCIVIRKTIFLAAGGFRKDLKFDDIELIRRIGGRYRFAHLRVPLFVSDRRFRTDGIMPTTVRYLALSILFFFHAFKLANRVPYVFARYHTKTE